MSIQPTSSSIATPSTWTHPEWDKFFAHFSKEITDDEKKQIINNMLEHLSHIIHEQMKRMVEAYKAMRE